VAPATPSLPALSLYIHIPWCVRKCPYCDFNSHESSNMDEAGYIAALKTDLADELETLSPRPLQSIFIGGGTPSLFSAEGIHDILQTVATSLPYSNDTEITMEANPGTFEQERFNGYRQAGINRLSIGVQSFEQAHLAALGRIHDAGEARRAIDIAQQAGFDNINIDLMFALPGQTLEQAVNDVRIACDSDVQHISHYQLTIEPNTYFHKHPPPLPADDDKWQIQTACQQFLMDSGYQQYEVSAYAKQGRRSRHNLNYWQFGDYIGIGAGAHGKITSGEGVISRRWKRRQPGDYIEHARIHDALSGDETLDESAVLFEYLLNALRLKHGVSLDSFETHTGLKRQQLVDYLQHIDSGLVEIDRDRLGTTEKGYNFLNEVLEKLLPEG